jgi:predicted RNase H-like nuclease (RuvC/YqgF family)
MRWEDSATVSVAIVTVLAFLYKLIELKQSETGKSSDKKNSNKKDKEEALLEMQFKILMGLTNSVTKLEVSFSELKDITMRQHNKLEEVRNVLVDIDKSVDKLYATQNETNKNGHN